MTWPKLILSTWIGWIDMSCSHAQWVGSFAVVNLWSFSGEKQPTGLLISWKCQVIVLCMPIKLHKPTIASCVSTLLLVAQLGWSVTRPSAHAHTTCQFGLLMEFLAHYISSTFNCFLSGLCTVFVFRRRSRGVISSSSSSVGLRCRVDNPCFF